MRLNLLTLAEMTSARVALPATALKRKTVTVLGGQEAKMSGPQLMFWNSIFLKKAKLNVYLTFFLQKSTLCFGLPPPSIVAPSNQLFVNQILSRKQLHYSVLSEKIFGVSNIWRFRLWTPYCEPLKTQKLWCFVCCYILTENFVTFKSNIFDKR